MIQPRLSGPLAALRGLLARPLASYYLLLATTALLLTIGLVMVWSATISLVDNNGHPTDPFAVITKQALWTVLGLAVFWFCQRLPVRTFRSIGLPLMVAAVPVMLFMLIGSIPEKGLSLGPVSVDTQGIWLYIGSLQVQPVEFAKLALVLWGAEVLSRKRDQLGDFRELALPFFPVAGVLLILVGYHDVGGMLCLLAVTGALLWIIGARMRLLGVVLGVVTSGVVSLIFFTGYRSIRIDAWLNPEKYADKEGLQILRSFEAIGHGGWFGVGLGSGSLKWGLLPESGNDFIYAIIAEELGVVGCVLVLVLFAVLAYAGLRIARRVADPFRQLAAGACSVWLAVQAIVNIAVAIGLIPITGITLPFISAGGSSMVVSLAAIGMLASFARAEPDAAAALHARPPGKWGRLLWARLPPLPEVGLTRTTPTQRKGSTSKGRI